MSVSYNTSIVTNGLVLALDAANTKSYPGSGTAWNNLSGNSVNATLVNSPTYNALNGGSFIFGSNIYASLGIPAILNQVQVPLTIIVWAKASSFGSFNTLYGVYSGVTGGNLYSMLRVDGGIFKYYSSASDGGYQGLGTLSVSTNTWNFYAVVVSGSISSPTVKMFLNNTSQSPSVSAFTTSPSSTVNFIVGSNIGNLTTEAWNGNISQVLVYTRALTDAEITQNFNALRGRYGL